MDSTNRYLIHITTNAGARWMSDKASGNYVKVTELDRAWPQQLVDLLFRNYSEEEIKELIKFLPIPLSTMTCNALRLYWRTGPQWCWARIRTSHPTVIATAQVIPLTWSGARTQTALSTSNKLIRSAAPLIHHAGLCYQLWVVVSRAFFFLLHNHSVNIK